MLNRKIDAVIEMMFIQKQSKPTSLIYSPDLTKLV